MRGNAELRSNTVPIERAELVGMQSQHQSLDSHVGDRLAEVVPGSSGG